MGQALLNPIQGAPTVGSVVIEDNLREVAQGRPINLRANGISNLHGGEAMAHDLFGRRLAGLVGGFMVR
jgi:hypothetical protein